MFDKLKKLLNFKSKDSEEISDFDNILDDIQDSVVSIDYDRYPDPEIIDNGKEETILFLDDIPNMWYLYNTDMDRIKSEHGRDIRKEFNIIKCLGEKAGFTAHKFIFKDYKKVDYAILDITLGFGVKLTNSEYVEYDGIDVLLELYKRNPDMKFIFCTAHTLNKKNPTVGYFFKKFESATGLKFEDHYVNKNSDRYKDIFKLLYGEDGDDN